MRKIVLIVVMILMSLLSFSGCSLPTTEFQMKKNAEKLLEEKYGEEFVAQKIWGTGGGAYDALCSPKSDKSIIFEGCYTKTGGNFRDEYVEALVGKELEKRLSPYLKKISDDFLIKPLVFYKVSNFTNKKDVTLEKYVNQVKNAECYYIIIIDKDKLKNISIADEYKVLLETSPNDCLISDSAVVLYLVDEKVLKKCNEYFKTHSNTDLEFNEIIGKKRDIGFGYVNNEINITFEDYSKLRQEIK